MDKCSSEPLQLLIVLCFVFSICKPTCGSYIYIEYMVLHLLVCIQVAHDVYVITTNMIAKIDFMFAVLCFFEKRVYGEVIL